MSLPLIATMWEGIIIPFTHGLREHVALGHSANKCGRVTLESRLSDSFSSALPPVCAAHTLSPCLKRVPLETPLGFDESEFHAIKPRHS